MKHALLWNLRFSWQWMWCCSLVDRKQCCGGICCLHLQAVKLYDVESQKTAVVESTIFCALMSCSVLEVYYSCCLLFACMAYSLTPKMEVVYSSKTLTNSHTMWHHTQKTVLFKRLMKTLNLVTIISNILHDLQIIFFKANYWHREESGMSISMVNCDMSVTICFSVFWHICWKPE